MRIVRNDEVPAISTEYGTLGEIFYGGTHVVLRTFHGLVSLTDPKMTWDIDSTKNIKMIVYPKGTKIVLEQE